VLGISDQLYLSGLLDSEWLALRIGVQIVCLASVLVLVSVLVAVLILSGPVVIQGASGNNAVCESDFHIQHRHVGGEELLHGVDTRARDSIEGEAHGSLVRIFTVADSAETGRVVAGCGRLGRVHLVSKNGDGSISNGVYL
jgi:hypothetical protein